MATEATVKWDDVDVDFGSEETANFGPRLEAGSALYQLNTQATIRAQGAPVTSQPIVSGCAAGDTVFVSSDRQMTVFAEGGRRFVATLSFFSNIEAVACTDDGKCFVVGEQFGEVHLFDVISCRKLFSKKLGSPALSSEKTSKTSGMPLSEELAASSESSQYSDNSPYRSQFTFLSISFTITSHNARTVCLTILTSTGLIHRIDGLDHTALVPAANDPQALKSILSRISFTTLDAREVHARAVTWVTNVRQTLGEGENREEWLLTAGAGNTNLCLWKKQGGSGSAGGGAFKPFRLAEHPANSSDHFALTRVEVTCAEFIISLDTSGSMSLWSLCSMTMLRMGRLMSEVTEFMIVGESVGAGVEEGGERARRRVEQILSDVKIVVRVNCRKNGNIWNELHICSLPSFDSLYSVRLEPFVRLATSTSSQDELFFIEGKSADDTPSCPPSTLRLRCLSETQPEARLTRLLQKGRYTEAENFCKLFRLDASVVLKAKVALLVDRLSSSEITSDESQKVMTDLKDNLSGLRDVDYIVQCCLSAAPRSIDLTLELLSYARARQEEASDATTLSVKGIADACHRLATFQLTFGGELFSGSAWEQFRSANMADLFMMSLRHGRIRDAATIWTRHHQEFSVGKLNGEQDGVITQTQLTEMLNIVTEESSSTDLHAWLKSDIIPYVVHNLPSSLHVIISWVEARARNMEIIQRAGWPRNALDFCGVVTASLDALSAALRGNNKDLFITPAEFANQVYSLSVAYSILKPPFVSKFSSSSSSSTSSSASASSSSSLPPCSAAEPFQRLCNLQQHLAMLCILRERYKCDLTLAQYQDETIESVAYRMLDRVSAAELVPAYVEKTIRPYMMEMGLPADRTLFRYVEDLTRRCGKIVSCFGDAAWEAKAIQIIRSINDADYKCQALLSAMSHAHIPFSTELDTLVTESLKTGHSRVADIKEKLHLIDFRKLVESYGLRNYNVGEHAQAQSLGFYILKKDRPTGLADALRVAAFYGRDPMDIYLFRLRLLAERDTDAVGPFLRSLAPADSLRCAEQFAQFAGSFLRDEPIPETSERRMAYASSYRETVRFLTQLLSRNKELLKVALWEVDEWLLTLRDVENVIALQREFDVRMTIDDLHNDRLRRELLDGFVAAGSEDNKKKETDAGVGDRQYMQSGKYESAFIYKNGKLVKRKVYSQSKVRPVAMTRCQNILSNVSIKGVCGKGATVTAAARLKSMYRFASLLCFTRAQVDDILVSRAVACGDYSAVISLTNDIATTSLDPTEIGSLLYTIAKRLVHSLSSAEVIPHKLPSEVSQMCNKALMYVCPNLLHQCIHLATGARLAETVYSHDKSATTPSEAQDKYNNIDTMLEENFNEGGFVLEAWDISPALYTFVVASLQSVEDARKQSLMHARKSSTEENIVPSINAADDQVNLVVQSMMSASEEIGMYLTSNHHNQLALAYNLEALACTTQFHVSALCRSHIIEDWHQASAGSGALHRKTENDKENVTVSQRSERTQSTSLLPSDQPPALPENIPNEQMPAENKRKENYFKDMVLPNVLKVKYDENRGIVFVVVTKIFGQYPMDQKLALACLMSLGKADALSLLRKAESIVGFNYRKARAAAEVKLAYHTAIHSDSAAISICRQQYATADWGYRLAKLRISFHEAMRGTSEEKQKLLHLLALSEQVKPSLILDYITTFDLHVERALGECLQYLMLPNESVAMSSIRPLDTAVAISRADRIADLIVQHRVKRVSLQSGSEEGGLGDYYHLLLSIFSRIDGHEYELLEFVLRRLIEICPTSATFRRNADVLSCLLSYKCVRVPDESSRNCVDFHGLIGSQRWPIISSELNESTVDVWIPIAGILGLTSDDVLMTTVRNIVSAYIGRNARDNAKSTMGRDSDNKGGSGGGMHMDAKEGGGGMRGDVIGGRVSKSGNITELFNVVKSLLLRLSSHQNVIQCLHWMLDQVNEDVEQLFVLNECVEACRVWAESCLTDGSVGVESCLTDSSVGVEFAREAHNKYVKMYQSLSTRVILKEHGLLETDLLALVGSPARLLFKLYEHPSIERLGQMFAGFTIAPVIQPSSLIAMEQPDDSAPISKAGGEMRREILMVPNIHAAADKIALVNAKKVDNIRQNLVQKWLPSSSKDRREELDVTMNAADLAALAGQSRLISTNESEEDDRNLARVTYILSHGPIESSIQLLVQFALRDTTTASFECRARALRVLFAIVDDFTSTAICVGMKSEALRDKLAEFMYLSELSRLHAPVSTVSEFISANKGGLARTVYRMNRGDPAALRLSASLCIDHKVTDPRIWTEFMSVINSGGQGNGARRGFEDGGSQLVVSLLEMVARIAPTTVWRLPCVAAALEKVAPSCDKERAVRLCHLIGQSSVALTSSSLFDRIQQFIEARAQRCALACVLALSPINKQRETIVKNIFSESLADVISGDVSDRADGIWRLPLDDLISDHVRVFLNPALISADTGGGGRAVSSTDGAEYGDVFMTVGSESNEVVS